MILRLKVGTFAGPQPDPWYAKLKGYILIEGHHEDGSPHVITAGVHVMDLSPATLDQKQGSELQSTGQKMLEKMIEDSSCTVFSDET